MSVTSRLIALALAWTLSACSAASAGSADAGTESPACVRSDPTCTMPIPSYSAVVHPILIATCVNCHYPGSPLAETSLTTYEDVSGELGSALGQVSSCLMPKAGYPQLTEMERAELLTWLACGAPDN